MAQSATICRLAAAAFLAGATAMSATASLAQVLEIAPGGAVTRYDGPTVFTDAGAAPIVQPKPQRRAALRQPARTAPAALRSELAAAARDASLSPDLVGAVAWRESGLRSDRVSRKGAIGAMQLMPATARALGVDPFDANANLHGGATYLARLMKRYDGDLLKALAAYNAGPGAVDRHGGSVPYAETRAYVDAVLERLSQAVVPTASAPTIR